MAKYGMFGAKLGKSGMPVFYEKLQVSIEKGRQEKERQKERDAARKKEQQRKRKNQRAKERRKEQERLRKEMEQVNKQFKKWDKKNLHSNDVELFKNQIEIFNATYGYDTDLFVPNMPLNQNVEDQIKNLIKAIKDRPELNVEYYEDLYRKMQDDTPTNDRRLRNLRDLKDEFDLDSVQDVIDFLDRHERYMSNAEIKDILSSDQYQDLSVYGVFSLGYSQAEVDYYILSEYAASGRKYVDLYNSVFSLLQTLAEEKKRRDTNNDAGVFTS